MNCSNFQRALKTWTADDWETVRDSIPPAIQEHAEDCRNCRSLLDTLLLLVNGATLKPEPPIYLASRIKAHLTEVRPGFSRRIGSSRRPMVLAAAALTVMVFALVLVFRIAAPGQTVLVRFHVETNADRVHVVGDWNGWDRSADPLTDPDGDGIWETEIRLLSNQEYRYQFLIDNERWLADPKATMNIDDGFGGINSVLHL